MGGMEKDAREKPVVLGVGSLELWPIGKLMESFGLTKHSASLLLKNLKVPALYLGKDKYFLLSALEEALFTALETGGPGFMAPASDPKVNNDLHAFAAKTLPDELLTDKKREARSRRMDRLKKQSSNRRRKRTMNLLGKGLKDAKAKNSIPGLMEAPVAKKS